MNQECARVKHLIETGYIKEFGEFIAEFQKKTLYKHLHMGFAAFDRRLKDPGLFNLNECATLAALVGVAPDIISNMAMKARKKKGKK
ncbi:MAG TPA: hypothetical protein VL832_11400 [Puia sp.]|jgi:hypothetical protein|nr:hypothetical protein [Puia sp.]